MSQIITNPSLEGPRKVLVAKIETRNDCLPIADGLNFRQISPIMFVSQDIELDNNKYSKIPINQKNYRFKMVFDEVGGNFTYVKYNQKQKNIFGEMKARIYCDFNGKPLIGKQFKKGVQASFTTNNAIEIILDNDLNSNCVICSVFKYWCDKYGKVDKRCLFIGRYLYNYKENILKDIGKKKISYLENAINAAFKKMEEKFPKKAIYIKN